MMTHPLRQRLQQTNNPQNQMKLKPEFVADVHRQSEALQERGVPLDCLTSRGRVEIWKQACPRLTTLLKDNGILLEYASLLDNQVRESASMEPGEYSQALRETERGMIPSDPETEQEWINQHTLPNAQTTT